MIKKIAKKFSTNILKGNISFYNALKVMSHVDGVASKRLSNSGQFLRKEQIKTILDSFKQGSDRAWTSVLFPAEILHPYKIWPVTLEVISGIMSTIGTSPAFLSHADGKGIPQTMCSFHRMLIGLSESKIIPKPLFVGATSTMCDGNSKSFGLAAEQERVPLLFLDVPYESSNEAVSYLRDQLKKFVKDLADITGKKLNDNVWKEQSRLINRTFDLHKRFYGFQKQSFKNLYRGFEVANFSFTLHYLLGHPRLESMLKEICKDCDAGKKTRNVYKDLHLKPDVKRLMWLHIVPQYDTPLWDLIDNGRVSKIVCDEYSSPYSENYDENDFFGSVAKRLIGHPSNGYINRRIEHILKTARDFKVDGLVHYSSWGCHQAAGNIGILEDAFRSEKIPFINLSGDAADVRNASFEQHRTRLEAFLEQLD